MATVPKVVRLLDSPLPLLKGKIPTEMASLKVLQEKMEKYETKPLDLTKGVFKEKICQQEFCCDFDIEFKYNNNLLVGQIFLYKNYLSYLFLFSLAI